MAGKLIQLEQAAKMLGMTPDQLIDMRQKNEIFGYRDGSTWKFKPDEIERVALDMGVEMIPFNDEDDLSSDQDLIASDDIDLKLEEDVTIDLAADPQATISPSDVLSEEPKGGSTGKMGSHILSGSESEPGESPSDTGKLVDGDNLLLAEDDLFVEDDLMLEEDSDEISLGPDSDMSSDFEDSSDAVLGDDSSSEILLDSGDSGINLSPTDSGLSLEEEPLEMGGSDIDSLELPEDDEVISLEDPDIDDSVDDAGDFMLTPIEGEIDDESSGSQVIALEDSEIYDDSSGSSSAIVDSDMDFSDAEPLVEDEGAFDDAAFDDAGFEDAGMMQPAAQAAAPAIPEAPYSFWNVLSLSLVFMFLCFGGIMTVDVARHLWNYEKPNSGTVNTFVMDRMIDMVGWNEVAN